MNVVIWRKNISTVHIYIRTLNGRGANTEYKLDKDKSWLREKNVLRKGEWSPNLFHNLLPTSNLKILLFTFVKTKTNQNSLVNRIKEY